MNCREIKQLLSLYLDNELGSDRIKQIEAHLQECPACMEYYRSLKTIKQCCGDLKVMNLPSGFHERLHQKLVEEEREKMPKKFKFKIAGGIAAGLALVFIGIALSSGIGLEGIGLKKQAYDTGSAAADMAMSEQSTSSARPQESQELDISFSENLASQKADEYALESEESSQRGGFSGYVESDGDIDNSTMQVQSTVERKIIKSAYLSVEILEFDRFINTINGKLNSLGGYVESSNVEGIPRNARGNTLRSAHFEIRIPREYFQQFITDVGELGNLLTRQEDGKDITGQYFDTEARLKSLQIQEERLLTILEKAEKLQDIIELERELSSVRYEIENLTGTLKKWDSMVAYSRISLDVYEVKELKEEEPEELTWGQRIIKGFTQSLEQLADLSKNFVVFIASALPYLVILGVLGWIVWNLVRWHLNHRRNNKKGDGMNE